MSGGNGNLVPSHPGNRNAERSGAFARRDLAQDDEVRALATDIMAAPHTVDMDLPGAIEIAKLMILTDRIDADLAERGLRNRKALLDMRLRASRRLAEWLDRYGMTPLARATWAKQMATGGLAEEIRRRQAAAREGGEQ